MASRISNSCVVSSEPAKRLPGTEWKKRNENLSPGGERTSETIEWRLAVSLLWWRPLVERAWTKWDLGGVGFDGRADPIMDLVLGSLVIPGPYPVSCRPLRLSSRLLDPIYRYLYPEGCGGSRTPATVEVRLKLHFHKSLLLQALNLFKA